MKSILFVCTGNICRSPMAEALLRHMLKAAKIADVETFSRGVYGERSQSMTNLALAELKNQRVDGKDHRSAQLTEADLDRADLILVMEYSHLDWINLHFPEAAPKTYLLKTYTKSDDDHVEVADPYGGSPADYQKCRMEIQNCLLDLMPKLKNL